VLVHLLFLGFTVLLALMNFTIPHSEQDELVRPVKGTEWLLAAPFAENLIGAFVLWRWRGLSLRSLRLWELLCFTIQAAYYGYFRFAILAYLQGASWSVSVVGVGFGGLASLQGFITLILAYGVLIPNTRRRSLLGVALLTAVPLAVIPAAVAINPLLR